MQRNFVIPNAAASSSIEIAEIDLGSALFALQTLQCNRAMKTLLYANFAYNNVFITLLNYMQYILAFTY